ncbi:hypothetical protein B4096_1368 [Heyndrickxia coagulans]|nr:hypothetical protein SB48_HM08orf00026 [Heyndrickxia coagulans]KYC61080.1 hypothetical protein B4100_1411 [Heyndrickxia coagulans]KYC61516.1 hypothetical protein B4098_2071 [Heyndrickxia coagulans]KYC71379.1 hypothetical protein B4096_1368 [Heyndrickxia coagulans]KYC72995.1 hypothetical protein B4099_1451 [Heyndrickxia coagulans]
MAHIPPTFISFNVIVTKKPRLLDNRLRFSKITFLIGG